MEMLKVGLDKMATSRHDKTGIGCQRRCKHWIGGQCSKSRIGRQQNQNLQLVAMWFSQDLSRKPGSATSGHPGALKSRIDRVKPESVIKGPVKLGSVV